MKDLVVAFEAITTNILYYLLNINYKNSRYSFSWLKPGAFCGGFGKIGPYISPLQIRKAMIFLSRPCAVEPFHAR
jgi:hypothetical protein